MLCHPRSIWLDAQALVPVGFVLLSSVAWSRPMQEIGQPSSDNATATQVAATVNDVPIYVAQVDRTVRESLGNRAATERVKSRLQAEALEQLILRQRALAYLQFRGEACGEQEIDLELNRLEQELSRQEKSLNDYCRAQGILLAALRQDVQWQLSWKRCLEKYLTDENLQRYFERHRQHFDGTKIRVAQILLRADAEQGQGEPQKRDLLSRARQIREQIMSKEITFADAARQYSQSPSGRDGGQLGWIEREGPMPAFFSRVAFDLNRGEVSQPVESPYGIHLIQCLEIEPGEHTWVDVRDTLVRAVSEYLFHWLASRPDVPYNVRFSGAVPYFEPDTRKLVVPADPSAASLSPAKT